MNHEQDIYTSLEEAGTEIKRRWRDNGLRQQVSDYLGGLPDCFIHEPRAVLFRNIASPDIEFHHFVEQAERVALKPVCLEYLNDRFCTRNADKICLAKLAIFNGRNKHGAAMISYKKVIDLKAADNKKFSVIDTLWGQNFVEFHHGLLHQHLPGMEICDVSDWHNFKDRHAADYYRYFLAFFVCHGVLFENFVTNEEEAVFYNAVVFPAMAEVTERFGVKPLIVPAIAEEKLQDEYWWCYPAHIEENKHYEQSTH
ncbi:MAG: hypothetical protein WC156_11630 [Pedobacter sp.]